MTTQADASPRFIDQVEGSAKEATGKLGTIKVCEGIEAEELEVSRVGAESTIDLPSANMPRKCFDIPATRSCRDKLSLLRCERLDPELQVLYDWLQSRFRHKRDNGVKELSCLLDALTDIELRAAIRFCETHELEALNIPFYWLHAWV